MFLNHFYLINDEDTVRHISQSFKENSVFHSNLQKNDDEEEDNIQFYENLPIDEVLNLPQNSTVIYEKPNVNDEFKNYVQLTNDAKPKLKYGNLSSIHSFTIPNKIVVSISGGFGDGLKWQTIQSICKENGIKFTNQSIGNLLLELKSKYFTEERKSFSNKERDEVLQLCNGKCKSCNTILNKSYHIDHIRPISNGGNNSVENLQSLCGTCHRDKSRQENEHCEYIAMDDALSSFNIQNTKLLQSNFFRKLAFTEELSKPNRDDNLFGIDISKCRRNILLHSKYDFCVFSVLDNIEVFDGALKLGIYYIECDNVFPMRGNMFYTFPIVKYALEKQLITLNNIKYQILPSSTLKKDYFNDFIDYLLNTVFKNTKELQKLSVNSLIGLFGRRKNSFIQHKICNRNDIDDIGCVYEEFHKPLMNNINDDIIAITGEVNINKVESYFPIHMQILDEEAVELHKMVCYITEKGGIPRILKTDCVIYNAYDEIDFNNFYWDDRQTIKKYKGLGDEVLSLVRGMDIKNTEKLVIDFQTYNEYNEDEDVINQIIHSNKGCLILGAAGTGKTYLINKLVDKLKDKKILRLAPTNISALLISGQTLDKFTHSFTNSKGTKTKYNDLDYVFIDEISMVRCLFYKVLISLKHHNPNIKFIISGDFYQLPPVENKIMKSYENSNALFELVDGNKLTLSKCKRSDDTLYNICDKVKLNQFVDINTFSKCKSYLNISFTNKQRIIVNNECIERYIKETNKPFIHIPKLYYDDNSQEYRLCEGMPLISRINLKSKCIFNNELYNVKKIKPNTIIVSNRMNEVEIDIDDIPRLFNVAFCITVHKSQGQTFNKDYTIYEWNKMDSTLRYVSLSRATDIKYINIV
jgi:hypothetical protein